MIDGLSPALHVAVERVNSHSLTKTFPSRWIAVLLPDTPLGRQIGPLLIERGMGEAGLERKVFTEHAAALAGLTGKGTYSFGHLSEYPMVLEYTLG